jgi:VWFA-related protein
LRRELLAIAIGLTGLVGAQEPPGIKVAVRLVTLPTLVFSRDNHLLPGLETSDFRVLDNGRAQNITLETNTPPVSVALVIQVNQDVREYTAFIKRAGSVVDALLVGESGEAAVILYNDEVAIRKPFDSGDVGAALGTISAGGRPARMIDAGIRAIRLLAQRPGSRARVLLFIGQPMDSGSESNLDSLRKNAEQENVAVYALTLPQLGKTFVSDTFSLEGLSSRTDRGGYKASVDLGKLISVMNRSAKAEQAADPFSILAAATGGTQLHLRTQRQLEDALAAIGVQLRSAYLLSYYPASKEPGYHTVKIEVAVPGAKVYARPGYWWDGE